jgi:hypothetical protein
MLLMTKKGLVHFNRLDYKNDYEFYTAIREAMRGK